MRIVSATGRDCGRGHIDRGREGDVWTHDPAHRAGVPYRYPRNERQFPSRVGDGQSFRGYDRGPASSEPFHRAAPAFESFGSGRAVQIQSQRGQISRGGGFGGFAAGGHISGGGHAGGGHR